MSEFLSLSQIAHWMGTAFRGKQVATCFVSDSRCVQKGALFFALGGARTDGHHFLKEVALAGAVGAVVAQSYEGPDHGLALIRVGDVLKALQAAAKERFCAMKIKTLAVTGSVGKTTTKGFTTALLKPHFKVLCAEGNQNTQVSLPLLLLNAKGDEQIAVLEMGMTKRGHIAQLVSIAPPDVALLLSVEYGHAENFTCLEEVALAKAEIFSHPKTQKGFVNGHLCALQQVCSIGQCSKELFSTQDFHADFFIQPQGEILEIYQKGKRIAFCPWQLPGVHNYQNFLGAALLAHAAGVGWEQISQTASSLILPPLRFQKSERRGITLINDAYNANAASICAALDALPTPKVGGRKIGILSDLLELGQFEEKEHNRVAIHALKHLDLLFCLGKKALYYEKIWRSAGRTIYCYQDRKELLEAVQTQAQAGDVLLFKGCRSYALEQLVEAF